MTLEPHLIVTSDKALEPACLVRDISSRPPPAPNPRTSTLTLILHNVPLQVLTEHVIVHDFVQGRELRQKFAVLSSAKVTA